MITSTQNDTIKSLMKLKQKKYRDETGLFLIEGHHLVEEAMKCHCVSQIITTTDEKYDIDTLQVSQNVMQKLAFTKTPQPIMAVCQKLESQGILENGQRYLLLDRIQDPGNVGTMMRTALALGYDQIIMSKDCVDLYNDKVIRSTQGALFQMKVCTMDLLEAIAELQNNQVQVYGTSLYHAHSIDCYDKQEKMAFVMGNEGQGVSQAVLEKCNHTLYIPIQSIESLNVAIAAAIVMYHFM